MIDDLKALLHPQGELGKLVRDSVLVLLGTVVTTVAADPAGYGVPVALVPLAGTLLLYAARKLRGAPPA
tara:strand:+ start:8734 stop:8940 length:207 start_codon:yes stop_codon:yes gene_type:complete